MKAATQSDWKDLLRQAVSEPGVLSKAYSNFHRYSAGNCISATFECFARDLEVGPINTFNGWKSLGRYVKKGEKAIHLCMPITHKTTVTNDEGEEEEKTFTRFVWRPNWFTMSQTDGDDYEAQETPEWTKENALTALDIKEETFKHTDGNVQGYAHDRVIAINPLNKQAHKTIFHEVAHILLGHTDVKAHDTKPPQSLREVEAESVAYLCCTLLGLNQVAESRGYIQHWLGEDDIPETSARRIFKVTNDILKAGQGVSA